MGDVIRFRPRPGGIMAAAAPEPAREPLWREVVGDELRRERRAQDRTQADVATDAGISVQYLSEIERGRKEPSSEIVQVVGAALGLRLVDLTGRATRRLVVARPSGPVALAA